MFARTVQVFAHGQRRDGAIVDQTGNAVYPTALSATVLQAPNGDLSFFVQEEASAAEETRALPTAPERRTTDGGCTIRREGGGQTVCGLVALSGK